jgi:hypothetical protein
MRWKIKERWLFDLAPLLFACLSGAANAIPSRNDTSWHKYIRAPNSRIILPAKIVQTTGNVSNAEALLGQAGDAIVTRPTSSDTVPSITLDFGINTVGFLQIAFAGASSNSPGIRLAFSESTQYLTNVSDFTRSDNGDSITPGTDQIAVPAIPTNWTDTHGCSNGSQVCADGLHGFRYLKIELDALDTDAPFTSSNGTIHISTVSLNYSAFLGTPDTFTGWFECSDETLNQYWYDAAYTNEMITDTFRSTDVDPRTAASPSLEGKLVLMDGAKRDRDPYVGDIAVSGRSAYLTHDVSIAGRNVLADLADHQRADGWIPPASINNYTLPLFDYSLWWVTCSWDYLLYTGDMDYAQTYFPTLLAVMDTWYPSVTNTSTGLLSKGLNNTSEYGDYAFLPRDGEVTYYNALYVLALKNAAGFATALGHATDATRWLQRAQVVSNATNNLLWDESVGAFLDSRDTTSGIRHAQDGNALAILSGIAPPNTQRAKTESQYMANSTYLPYGNAFYDSDAGLTGVTNATKRVYAFISYFDIQARFLTEGADSALEEIGRLYGYMASNDPGTTMWEGIGPPDRGPDEGGTDELKYEGPYTSLAHGWSTGVLPALTNFVLGITPTGVGFKTWTVKPYLTSDKNSGSDITWARGVVSTPGGPIYVAWAKGNGSTLFTLEVDAPEGTVGTIDVPVGTEETGFQVVLNGEVIFSNGTGLGNSTGMKPLDGYFTLDALSGGTHSVSVTGL